MASTEYPLTTDAWADCGAADDCTLQIPAGTAAIIFTTAATDPGAGVNRGLRLSTDARDERSATVQKAGLNVWARALGGATILTVER